MRCCAIIPSRLFSLVEYKVEHRLLEGLPFAVRTALALFMPMAATIPNALDFSQRRINLYALFTSMQTYSLSVGHFKCHHASISATSHTHASQDLHGRRLMPRRLLAYFGSASSTTTPHRQCPRNSVHVTAAVPPTSSSSLKCGRTAEDKEEETYQADEGGEAGPLRSSVQAFLRQNRNSWRQCSTAETNLRRIGHSSNTSPQSARSGHVTDMLRP